MMGEVLCWGAESHFKTLCENINLSTGCVSHWISTISGQMWIHYESDKINLFLLTGMFCQGSHLSQYRSCSPSLYRKPKTNKKKIYLSVIKHISNKIKKSSKNAVVSVAQLHSIQCAGSCWNYVPKPQNAKFSSNFQYITAGKKKRQITWKRNGGKKLC